MPKIFKNTTIQSIVAISTVVFTIIYNLIILSTRVSAIEERNLKTDPLIPQFIQLQQQVVDMGRDITEIKETTKDMDSKIDKLIERL